VRVVLLSDIHGNLVALDAVLEDMARQGPFDHTVVAGDLVWAGPWPAEVVDRVRSLDAAVIQGNTDAFLSHQPDDTPEDKDQKHFAALVEWYTAVLGPERVAYLLNLPFAHRIAPAAGHDLLVVHANPQDQEQAISPRMSDEDLEVLLGPPEACDWEALAFGHLHIPYNRRWHDRLLADVSGCGLPMDGDRRAAYTILTWEGTTWQVEHRRVLYAVPEVVHKMQTGGMPRGKHFAERLLRARYDR
jgi:predicted phosphodiesterase